LAEGKVTPVTVGRYALTARRVVLQASTRGGHPFPTTKRQVKALENTFRSVRGGEGRIGGGGSGSGDGGATNGTTSTYR